MKKLFVLLCALSLPFAVMAEDDGDGTAVRPSVIHGDTRIHYMGSVNGGMAFLGFYLHTSHGAVFPKENLYAGVGLDYNWLYGENCIDVTAHGKWFYPWRGRVQGYIGLQAGVGVMLPGYTHPEPGVSDYYPASAAFVITPGLGFVINFSKVSLDIGAKCRLSPDITMGTGTGYVWSPIAALGIGLIF